VTGSHRHGALCPHQRLWLVWPLGSSLASQPSHWASHPAGPFPHRFHPQDPRALDPRGRSALLPDPSRVWTSHPCAGPGGRRFRHSPGRPTEEAPSPQRLRTPHGGPEGGLGSWRSLSACPLGSHPLNKDCKCLWKWGGCGAGETRVGPVWRAGVSKLQSTGQVFSELEVWTAQNLPTKWRDWLPSLLRQSEHGLERNLQAQHFRRQWVDYKQRDNVGTASTVG
jgi:hypothetical protein